MSEYWDFYADFYQQRYDAAGWHGGAAVDVTNAEIAYAAEDYNGALGSLILACRHMVDGLDFLYDVYQYPAPRYNICKLFHLLGEFMDEAGVYELTMADLLSTMVTADESEYRYFIGLVDAYRVGLWNKPFNAEFFAALARGFAQG